jgi:type II secretory pathway predicted ATPase ExeA
MTRLETFVNLGYHKDPLKGPLFETGDMIRARRILTMAVESRAMISIVGERGCGKSAAVNAALKKLPVKTVWVSRGDQEKLTISDIKTAMILNLSAEGVKRGGIVSSMQLRRVVGEASRKQKVVIAIEEAQRLHPSTLKSLKTLREIEWMGETELFTIILVAQSDPMNRPGVSEVKLRSDIVRMQGLSANEAGHYVRESLGKHFEEPAIDLLAELPQAKNYLELQALCVELLGLALAAGREKVGIADVHTIQPPASAPVPRGQRPAAPKAAVTATTALASVLDRRQGRIDDLSKDPLGPKGVADASA